MDVLRLSEWGSCCNLDFDPIGVFEKDGVVFFSACERMSFGIQQRDAATLQFFVQFVHLMLCVYSEGQVVQSGPSAVIGSIQETFGCLDEDDVCIIFLVAEALLPFLVFAEAQLFQQPRPQLLAGRQIADIDFDMMNEAHLPTSFSFVTTLSRLQFKSRFFVPSGWICYSQSINNLEIICTNVFRIKNRRKL